MKPAYWLIAPSLLGALLLALVETGIVFPAVNPIGTDVRTQTFADSIARHGVEQAYAYVRAGQNPNQPVALNDSRLTGNRELLLPPLIIALAARNENTAMMLLSFGADPALPQQAGAACLADWVDLPGVARLIRAVPGGDTPCPPKPVGDAPLATAFARQPR